MLLLDLAIINFAVFYISESIDLKNQILTAIKFENIQKYFLSITLRIILPTK